MSQSHWYQLDWVWQTAGWSLLALGSLFLLWSLFADRAKGRPRCPKCWYDMRGIPTLRCPECGHEPKHKHKLLKTRRHWRSAFLAAFILTLGIASLAFISYRRGGWERIVPSTLLVAFASTDPPSATSFWPMPRGIGITPMGASLSAAASTPTPWRERLRNETWRRLSDNEYWSWQRHCFISRIIALEPGGIKAAVGYPARWPAGEAIRVRVKSSATLRSHGLSLTAKRTPSLPESDKYTNISFLSAASVSSKYLLHLDLDVKDSARSLYATSFDAPITIVPDTLSVFRRDDSAALTERFSRALNPYLDGGGPKPSLSFGPSSFSNPAWIGFNEYFGSRVELRIGEQLLATGYFYPPTNRDGEISGELLHMDWSPDASARIAADPNKVRIRVIGDPELSWNMFSACPYNNPDPACWTGVIELPPVIRGVP